ncbi:hypothetical protein [Methanothrix soehngenii]|uniref:hypothetical protein n=1 Tax=Methanothrix soehngenii TaxID=2223 RepID=UPI00300CE4FA
MTCYYRFGFVSIIIARKYYFFGRIDVLSEPLPTATLKIKPLLQLQAGLGSIEEKEKDSGKGRCCYLPGL